MRVENKDEILGVLHQRAKTALAVVQFTLNLPAFADVGADADDPNNAILLITLRREPHIEGKVRNIRFNTMLFAFQAALKAFHHLGGIVVDIKRRTPNHFANICTREKRAFALCQGKPQIRIESKENHRGVVGNGAKTTFAFSQGSFDSFAGGNIHQHRDISVDLARLIVSGRRVDAVIDGRAIFARPVHVCSFKHSSFQALSHEPVVGVNFFLGHGGKHLAIYFLGLPAQNSLGATVPQTANAPFSIQIKNGHRGGFQHNAQILVHLLKL